MKKKNKVDKGSHYNKKGAWAIVRKAKQARASGQLLSETLLFIHHGKYGHLKWNLRHQRHLPQAQLCQNSRSPTNSFKTSFSFNNQKRQTHKLDSRCFHDRTIPILMNPSTH